MPRRPNQTELRAAARWFLRQAPAVQAAVFILAVLAGLAYVAYRERPVGPNSPAPRERPAAAPPPAAGPGEYFFCFWNVENLFDDQNDHRPAPDDAYDRYFSLRPEALRLKLDRLTSALLEMNGGRGPDILAVAEVEGVRAAELLQDALNAKLGGKATPYGEPLARDGGVGRHIMPAVISRLPAVRDKTRTHGSGLRILEAHLAAADRELVVVASHWTSRVSDKTGEARARYGDQIRGVFNGMARSNPDVAFLVCGDFNDEPDKPSVTRHLRAVGDRAAVLRGGSEPPLYNLFAGHAADDSGTLYYDGRWSIFDQIAVSPAMLRGPGWRVVPDTARAVRSLVRPGDRAKRPWRFGGERDDGRERGWSDHFPVTVVLRVG